ncbi:MAG: hypothetical protein QM751_04310 [Paludibacteraceae bacterium]
MKKPIMRKLYVITDVQVWDMKTEKFNDFDLYTGIAANKQTDPFIPGVVGECIAATDVNHKIGGHTVGIYVKYQTLDTSNADDLKVNVLTNIEVQHWPDWKPALPDGWMRANGIVSGKQGALTAGTKSACWCNGLIVQYKELGGYFKFSLYINNESVPECNRWRKG